MFPEAPDFSQEWFTNNGAQKLKFDVNDLINNLRMKLNNADFQNSQLEAVISSLNREIEQKEQKIKDLESKDHSQLKK